VLLLIIACDKRKAFAKGSVSDEATQSSILDCFASLAMTGNSELSEQCIAAGNLDLAGRGFEVEFFHDTVFDQH
jgi:hypothetical protein